MIDLSRDFRRPDSIRGYSAAIHELCLKHDIKAGFMEVCGGHTHTIARYSLEQLLPESIRLIHGPGCPVCILPKERIDHAVILARRPGTILVTTGDMIRVPGSGMSLEQARAAGSDVRTVYSPLEIPEIAAANSDKTVVYFAIGFETTTPSTALLVDRALSNDLKNLFFYTNHVLVPPVLEALLADPEHRISGFIAPSHVSAITGSDIYRPVAEKHHLPVVVAGFEPADVMESVYMLVRQLAEGCSKVEIQYARCVSPEGNRKAQALVEKYFTPEEEFNWRGPGKIPGSSLGLRKEFAFLDARQVFAAELPEIHVQDHRLCICAEILRGKKRPGDCKVFGTRCTPDSPVGSCMVSGEGACAAYYKYGRENETNSALP